MTILRYFLFIAVLLFLFLPASAFEDTFQYYPSGDYSEEWFTDESGANDIYHDIITNGGTYSRCFRLGLDNDAASGEYVQLWHRTPSISNYWSVNFRYLHTPRTFPSNAYSILKLNVYFYDEDGYQLFYHSFLGSNPTYPNHPMYGTSGLFEYLRDTSSDQVTLRVDGVDKGVVGSASKPMAYISFRIDQNSGDSQSIPGWMYIDDVTSGGNIVGIGTESTTHTVTEAYNDDTNISFGINTFPLASYQASEYEVDIKRSVSGVYTDVISEVVKPAGDSTPTKGFSNWDRSVDLTNGDTDYGLYMVYLLDDGTSIDTDYFFLVPPGDASSISFSNPEIPIGTTQTITYSIDGANFGTYNYHVRIYSTTAQIQSTQVSEESSTVTWDTTGETTGLHYAVLSRTDKTSGAYSELTYDIATLSDTIIIRGYAYDAQNESTLADVNVNLSQAATWFNTTSNATGYYELTGLIVDVEVNVNASLANYTHENFTFTPLSAEIYTMDLYLINNTPTYSNTTIGGLTYDYPLHQAVTNANVNIYNTTWSDNTTSSSTGFYLFEELTNGSYTVNATKTDFQDSAEYPTDTNNGSWLTQNILMYGIYDLTIRAQDATTDGYLSTFSIDYNGVISSTTNGSITYSGLTYGLYTFSVSATGYYSDSEDILVDSTKTETIQITQTDSIYYTPHYVKFVVWGPMGYYEGVDVSVYEYGVSTTKYTGVTGNDGAVTFRLYETQRYTITFIDAVQGIDREMVLYPKDEKYLIFVASTGSWSTFDEPINDVVGIEVSTKIINSTHSYVNVSYTDTLSETTAATVYLNQSNSSDPYNQTVIDSQSGYTNNWTHSFIVSDYEGESYYIHVVATHTTYGTVDQTYAIQFDSDIGLPGIPDKVWLYVAILIMMFTAGMFGASTATEGAAIICVEGWVFLFFGWFSSIDNNGIIAVGLGAATTIAIFANINKFSKKEGHE
ncbi:hypothetical protein GQ473_07400 [archaeon]|nr:hypothetical protein [archaeon]